MEFIPVLPADAGAVADMLLGEVWPYHSPKPWDRASLVERVRNGGYWSDGTRTFWIVTGGERAGTVQLRDLGDPTPMFDLRLRESFRGRGLGTQTVRWLAGYLFAEYPGIARIEGHTRHDNIAMRRTFERCGWVQEAHYRMAWPGADGTLLDATGYAILRRDHESGTSTPASLGCAVQAAGVRSDIPVSGRAPFQVLVFPYIIERDDIYYALFRRDASTGDYWQGIAGGGEGEEMPPDAARREAFEEAGIVPESPFVKLDSMAMLPVVNVCGFHWGLEKPVIPEYAFGVRVKGRALHISGEHSEYLWSTIEEAMSMVRWDSNRNALWELNHRIRNGMIAVM